MTVTAWLKYDVPLNAQAVIVTFLDQLIEYLDSVLDQLAGASDNHRPPSRGACRLVLDGDGHFD